MLGLIKLWYDNLRVKLCLCWTVSGKQGGVGLNLLQGRNLCFEISVQLAPPSQLNYNEYTVSGNIRRRERAGRLPSFAKGFKKNEVVNTSYR